MASVYDWEKHLKLNAEFMRLEARENAPHHWGNLGDAILGLIRLFLSNIQVQQSQVAGLGHDSILLPFQSPEAALVVAILAWVDGFAYDGRRSSDFLTGSEFARATQQKNDRPKGMGGAVTARS